MTEDTAMSVADAQGVKHEIKCDAFAAAALHDVLQRLNDLEAFARYVHDSLTYTPRERKVLTAVARQIQRRAEKLISRDGAVQ